MRNEEIINILTSKETWDNYHQFINLLDNSNKDLIDYFSDYLELLNNDTDYIRFRTYALIATISKYDSNNLINNNIDVILNVFNIIKPTLIRQLIKYSKLLIANKIELKDVIIKRIDGIDISIFNSSMKPLIIKDINSIKKEFNYGI